MTTPAQTGPARDTGATTLRLREFAFGEEDFQALRALVKSLTGIHLSEQKRELVYGRLTRRLRALQLRTFAEYREQLNGDVQELAELCNAITTNLTSFFREPHHFQYLREHVLAPLVADPRGSRRLRIWSAGCSTGEEPYSIAMTVLEALPDLRRLGRADPRHGSRLGGPRAGPPRHLSPRADGHSRRPSACSASSSSARRRAGSAGRSRPKSRRWSLSNSSISSTRCR